MSKPEDSNPPENEATEVDDADPVPDDVPDAPDEGSEITKSDNVRRLLPVHAAPNTGKNGLKVTRAVGRPRKVERMPTTKDLDYHSEMSEEKAKFIEQDDIVKAVKGRVDATGILRLIKLEVAKEAAALHFQRIENEKFGKDTSQTSTRRLDALTKISNIELEIRKLGSNLPDLHGEQMQRIFKFWISKLQEVAEGTLPSESIDLFFNRLSSALEGWEDKASENAV